MSSRNVLIAAAFVALSSMTLWMSAGSSRPVPSGVATTSDRSAASQLTSAPSSKRTFYIGMTAAFVSEKGVDVYQKIADYLTAHTGHSCELVTGLSYSTVSAMLEAGQIDVAFVCGLPYVLDQEKETPSTRLLCVPVMQGKRYRNVPKYFSYTIVRKDSPRSSFEDLAGTRYVYNDELSNSGYNLPRAKLVELGRTDGFFGEVLRSGSHEESIRMVAMGEADASSVDSLVFDYDLAKHPRFAAQLKIIETLGPAGICPVVASSKLDDQAFTQLQDALVSMRNSVDGRGILDDALVDRFERGDDANFDDIRAYRNSALDSGFHEIR